jgi:hypothetical protein
MPQKPLGGLLVNERGKATTFWLSPGVQLNHMVAVIDSPLKRWGIPHLTNRCSLNPRVTKQTFTGPDPSKLRARCSGSVVRGSTARFFGDPDYRSPVVPSPYWLFDEAHRSGRLEGL